MSDAVRDYYDANAEREWDRLERGGMRLEWASTWRLIDRHFPTEGIVLDIGGGPGRYTLELMRRGYKVTLIELSSALATIAAEKIHAAKLHPAIICADAREVLPVLKAGTADAALLLGPLYHLPSASDRAALLSQLRRILKPGGVVVAAFLNSLGLLRTGLVDFPARFDELEGARALMGERSFTARELPGFTECHWATPDSALGELEAAGFEIVTRAGVEGFASGLRTTLDAMAREHPARFENICALAAETSEHPAYRDCTDHLHVVARRL